MWTRRHHETRASDASTRRDPSARAKSCDDDDSLCDALRAPRGGRARRATWTRATESSSARARESSGTNTRGVRGDAIGGGVRSHR